MNKGLAEEGVLEEAEFYNIAKLIDLVKERIMHRDNRPSKDGKKHVYRVLQCHEDELTQVNLYIKYIVSFISQYPFRSDLPMSFLNTV